MRRIKVTDGPTKCEFWHCEEDAGWRVMMTAYGKRAFTLDVCGPDHLSKVKTDLKALGDRPGFDVTVLVLAAMRGEAR